MALRDRVYHRKERNPESRKRNPAIFMAAEGKNKTEKLYFKAFSKDIATKIKFATGSSTDPKGMIDELRSFMLSNGFDPEIGDKAYCFIDTDKEDIEKDSIIADTDKDSARNNIKLIVSAPCFEIWFICHFEYPTKTYSSSSKVIRELKKKYFPDYDKSDPNMYDKTKNKIEDAIKNSKLSERNLINNGYKPHTTSFAPSTEVYKIIEEFYKN